MKRGRQVAFCMTRLLFSAAGSSYCTETKLVRFCAFWCHFIFLLLVFRRFLEPNRRFTLAVGSDVRGGGNGVSLGYGKCAVENRTGRTWCTVHRQLTGRVTWQHSINEPLALYDLHRKRQVPSNQTTPCKCPDVRPIIPTCYSFQTAITNMNFYVY
jgi:hypothetical protein